MGGSLKGAMGTCDKEETGTSQREAPAEPPTHTEDATMGENLPGYDREALNWLEARIAN